MAQSISIKIAERPYSLKVTSPDQEEVIRKAADDINRKIALYQENPNASGGLTPLSPPSELQEIPVAIRERSGVLCFHSR